jgi:hypothetical protein
MLPFYHDHYCWIYEFLKATVSLAPRILLVFQNSTSNSVFSTKDTVRFSKFQKQQCFIRKKHCWIFKTQKATVFYAIKALLDFQNLKSNSVLRNKGTVGFSKPQKQQCFMQ